MSKEIFGVSLGSLGILLAIFGAIMFWIQIGPSFFGGYPLGIIFMTLGAIMYNGFPSIKGSMGYIKDSIPIFILAIMLVMWGYRTYGLEFVTSKLVGGLFGWVVVGSFFIPLAKRFLSKRT